MGPDASVGTAHDSGVDLAFADAPTNVPVDAGTGADTSASGGAGGAGGTTATGGTTNTGGTTTTGGITSTGGAAATGGIPSTGGSTSSAPDAAVDSPAAADATTTPSQTVALFHFDGIATPTVLTDSSGTGKVATITGNPVISTAQSKFGGASLYVNGNSSAHTNYVLVDLGSGQDFTFDGDYTLDWWQYVVQYTDSWGSIVNIGNSTPAAPDWAFCTSAAVIAVGWNGTSLCATNGCPTFQTPATNSWHHIALARAGTTVRVFVDGSLAYQSTSSSTAGGRFLSISGAPCEAPGATDNGDFNGYVDELRVVKGTAIWTSDFTPPTAEYQ